jgi:hypothetical protein
VVDIHRFRLPAALEWPQVIMGGLVVLGAIGMNGGARLL